MAWQIRRRRFIAATATALGATALGRSVVHPATATDHVDPDNRPIGPLVFNETSSLLDANHERLTDDDVVFVYSEDGATAGEYSDEPVPLWAADGNFFGSGSLLVDDAEGDFALDYGQDVVLLNIIESFAGSEATILLDEVDPNYTLETDYTKFGAWVGSEGHTIESATDLTADLEDADALLIPVPDDEHDDDQIAAIEEFAAAGNPVFLFNEADSWDTDDLNHLASALDLAFRFDDDEVESEPGFDWDDWPITQNYDLEGHPEWFEYRPGAGFNPGEQYEAEIVDIIDGDTFDVEHLDKGREGMEDTIRHLGQDTPETPSVGNDPEEFRGIEDEGYLDDMGQKATEYAESLFDEGDVITFWVDEAELPARGLFGRLLAYHGYPDGHEREGQVYNYDVIEDGYAKPYNSAFTDHHEYVEAYWDAYEAGLAVWEESDAESTEERWNRDVQTLRFRSARAIDATDDETAVWADDGDAVVGVDTDSHIALVGGVTNADNWEDDDDENFVFSANLARELSDEAVDDDMLLIEGGHGQFAASYDLSFEGQEAFHRFIEGLDAMWFQAINVLDSEWLDVDEGRHAVIITPPDAGFEYSDDEVDALAAYIADGGAVILKADTDVPAEGVATLNDLARDLGTDLRFTDTPLGNVETEAFNDDFELWDAYEHDGPTDGDDDDDDDDCWPPGQC